MHRVAAVGRRQGRRQLVDDPDGVIRFERAARERLLEVPAAHPSHHEIGAAPVAPVVVERDDVGMLESCDRLRFLLEATNEARVVGESRMDLLDAHLAAEIGIERSPHDAEGPLADAFEEAVATERLARQLQRRVLLQDPPVEILELRGGVDPQLIGEQLLGSPVAFQRVGLPPRAVAGEHQMVPESLPERMLGDQPFEIGQHLRVLSDGETGGQQVLHGVGAQLLQARDLTDEGRRLREVAQR